MHKSFQRTLGALLWITLLIVITYVFLDYK